MPIDTLLLPSRRALVRARVAGQPRLLLHQDGALLDLSGAADDRLHSLDRLLSLHVEEIAGALDAVDPWSLPVVEPAEAALLAPVEGQEVWAAGVTYRRSREARMEEATAADIYALVYEAARPELFFKAAGWRVVAPGGDVGVRSDSTWDVPEPELAVLSNRFGEVVAYACGNDMSSRSIEGENPLYLPQAKVYDDACALGPAAVFAFDAPLGTPAIDLTIRRGGEEVFAGSTDLGAMVRRPDELVHVMHAAYTLPVGAWLLTGTGIVPPSSYTAQDGDEIEIRVEGLGVLRNRVREVRHSGAVAPPHTEDEWRRGE
jgi:2-dehydro-3-deoxy-D-arabinonate dehydratase